MKFQRFKDMAAVLVIVFLLPYVTSIVVSGFPEKDSKKAYNAGQTVCVAYENRKETISLQQYLIGVLAAQVPVDYEMETLKAHSVLVRTYYELHEKNMEVIEKSTSSQNFLTEEKMQQLWGDRFETNYRKLEQAVIDTNGQCLYYQDKLAESYFHTASAGWTRSGEEVFQSEEYGYLYPAACEKDLQADNYVTIKTFTKEELIELIAQFQEDRRDVVTAESIKIQNEDIENISPVEWFRIVNRDKAGYVTEIEVNGILMHGETFRTVMQLPSGAFQIEEWDDGVRFVCKGLGHGLGMSLFTANELAKEGKSYEDILNYFFKNITLVPSK